MRIDHNTATVKRALQGLGIDVFVPVSGKEESMAQALAEFADFILFQEQESCQAILDKHLGSGHVGELQGGSEEYEIYRVNILTSDNDSGEVTPVVTELLEQFHANRNKRHVLTVDKLQKYMINMCHHRSTSINRLGNLMFILTFGETHGQVRHIDNMDPNLQICLYMSTDCPATTVYEMQEPAVTNVEELVEYWEASLGNVPELIKTILQKEQDTPLKLKSHTKYFGFWDTINTMLGYFGALYLPVTQQLVLQSVDPGTTLLVSGNQVHSGPSTTGPRMFCFAIGIPDESSNEEETNDDNNGEVQYNPVLLHLDLCCILFGIMEFECSEEEEAKLEAKRFLLDIAVDFIREYPKETYVRLLGNDRKELREWLGDMVTACGNNSAIVEKRLGEQALESKTLLYSPDCSSKKRINKGARRKKM